MLKRFFKREEPRSKYPDINVPAVTLPLDLALATMFRGYNDVSNKLVETNANDSLLLEQIREIRQAVIVHLQEHEKEKMHDILHKRADVEEVPDDGTPKRDPRPN